MKMKNQTMTNTGNFAVYKRKGLCFVQIQTYITDVYKKTMLPTTVV